MLTKVRNNYISKAEFNPGDVRKKSVAAASMCIWVKALNNYSIVLAKVEPKRRRLNEVTEKLDAAKKVLGEKMEEVRKVRESVNTLERKCQEMADEKDRLEQEMDTCEKRMGRAEKLLVLLADEGVRWSETVVRMEGEIEELVGNVFLSAACISYYGAFTGAYRKELVDLWVSESVKKGIPISSDFNLIKVMGEPVQIREWNQKGLPTDTVSIENGILATKGQRWPLMIDPQ